MKKIFLLIASVITISDMAQCPSNGTHTDPTPGLLPANGGATPANNTFQQNTFDWTQPIWPVYYRDHFAPSLFPGTIQNPFYSSTLFYPFAKGASSDFNPSDGWELIKQDMGYFYASAASPPWQGNPMGYFPLYSNDPRKNGSQINYFVIYNKYSSILRVMGQIPKFNNENTIYVKMRFLTSSDFNSSDPYQPNVNALFNHYNPTTALALDQKTVVTEVSAPAQYPSSGEMFYADFQLAYDPCVCLFEGGFEVHFSSIQTSTLKLSGSYAGVSGIDIASVNAGSGTVIGSNSGDDFLASLYNAGITPQSAILSYNQAQNVVSQNAAQQAIIDQLNTGLELASGLIDVAGSAIPDLEAAAPFVKGALDLGSKVASYYSAELKNPPAAAITLETGYLQATGTISEDPSTYGGINFRVGVPGSKDANTLPEYAPANSFGDVLPNYPMYNEPTGLFALLKTPKVNSYRHSPAQSDWGQVNFYNNGQNAFYLCQFYYGDQPSIPNGGPPNHIVKPASDYFTIEYNPAENLVYALSPMVDASKSTINVAYEIDGMPNNASNGHYSVHSLTGFKDVVPSINSFVRNRTPFYPISCNTNIFTQEKINYTQNYKSGNWIDPSYCPAQGGNTGACTYYVNDAPNLFYNNSDLSLISNIKNVRLVVSLYLVTLPDQYGKVHATAQIIKYDCDLNYITTDFETSGNGASAISAFNSPTNLQLHTATYTNPQDIYSFGTIVIDGEQFNPSTGLVNIAAEKEINIKNGGVLHDEEHLYISDLPISIISACSTGVASTLSGANLAAYCTTGYNGNQYMANQSRMMASNNNGPTKTNNVSQAMTVTKLGTDIKLGIFPNPTTGLVYLNMSAQKSGNVIVNIMDINGQLVANNTYNAETGANTFKLDLSNLQNGVYAIRVTDDANNIIKMDKIILTK